MNLHYATKEEVDTWTLEVKIGFSGLSKECVHYFRLFCKDIIGSEGNSEESLDKALNLAKSLLSGIIPSGLLKKRLVGQMGSFDMWYSFVLDGDIVSFGLNTRIPEEVINQIQWI